MRQMNKQTNSAYKLICYYSSWAWLRRNDAKFVPENVISTDCTHILYAYAGLDPKDLILKSNDRWTDFDNSKFIVNKKLNKLLSNTSLMSCMKNTLPE